ncbi:hypothetical protein [Haloarcula sp. CBA1122]|uniref:hypothetical protein n=1 Tax=Haloarcula sp. CBA1122 TaxID=2668069 RepID=UPI0018D23B04|nr:hypothetical protein [Haloarcula sp. CBA1122]
MTKPVRTTIEAPDRPTTWAWGSPSPLVWLRETHRQREDLACDRPRAETVEQ